MKRKKQIEHSPKIIKLATSLVDPIKRSRLIMIGDALNKDITGLDGKKLNLRTVVWYGINGYLFSDIAELLK